MIKLKEKSKNLSFQITCYIKTPHEYLPNDKKYNILGFSFGKTSYYFEIPEIIKPKQKNVSYKNFSYVDYIRKQYGFTTFEDHIHLYYGIQPDSWSKNDPENSNHTKSFEMSWKNYEYRGINFYQYHAGRHYFVKSFDADEEYEKIRNFKSSSLLPKYYFQFNDYDGTKITATCWIEEMMWTKGTKIFSWLRHFHKPLVKRVLEMNFDIECGRGKENWKGGLIACSTDIKDGESPYQAFLRFSKGYDHIKYQGKKCRDFTNIIEIFPQE